MSDEKGENGAAECQAFSRVPNSRDATVGRRGATLMLPPVAVLALRSLVARQAQVSPPSHAQSGRRNPKNGRDLPPRKARCGAKCIGA